MLQGDVSRGVSVYIYIYIYAHTHTHTHIQVKMLQGDFSRGVECLKRGAAILDEVWKEGSQSRVSFGAAIMYDMSVCYVRLGR